MIRILSVIILALAIAIPMAFSQAESVSVDPLTFGRWKDHQVVEAKNQVVRLSNRLHLLKTGRYKVESVKIDGEPLLGDEGEKEYNDLKTGGVDEETLKKAEDKVLKTVQDKMKAALENLQYAKELSVDDYLEVYLSRFKDDELALKKVVAKLSENEVMQILKTQMAKGPGGRKSQLPAADLSNIKAADAAPAQAPKNL